MQPTTRAIKAQARTAMGKASPSYWKVTLVYLLLVTFLPNAIYEIFDASLFSLVIEIVENPSSLLDSALIGLFVTLVVTLVSMVIQLGYSLWSLRCWRQEEENGLGSLFEGFGSVGRIILSVLLVMLYTLGWMTLLGTAMYTIFSSLLGSSSSLSYLMMLLYVISFFVAVVLIVLRYSLVSYVLVERPDLSAFRAVSVASYMTRGHLWRLFRLYFSFIGLFLVANLLSMGASLVAVHATVGLQAEYALDYMQMMNLLSAPIPYWAGLVADALVALFLTPYIAVSTAGFFDGLVRPQQPQQTIHNSDIY